MPPTVCRFEPPAPAPPRNFRFPELQTRQLPNGLRLLGACRPDTPLVDVQLLFPAGAQYEPHGQAGLASLTAALLDEGTTTHSSRQIAATIEQLGGYLAAGADWNRTYASVGALAKDLDSALEILCEVATTPTFPEEEIERHRERRLAELRQRCEDPVAMAGDLLARVLYGDGTYARPLLGTSDSLTRLTRQLLHEFYAEHVNPQQCYAIAVGDLDVDRLVGQLGAGLEALPAGSIPAGAAVEPRPLAGVEVHLLDRPQAQQTELRLGHAGSPRNHPDRVPLRVLNSILGGKFTSRINLNLRERHGYTYGAHSRFVERLGPGPFVVSTAVDNSVAGRAAREVIGELERMVGEPVSAEELEDARSYLLGIFPYLIQNLQGLAARLEEIATYSLPDDYFDLYPEALRRVSRDQLLRVARDHVDPERLAIVAVGPAAELRPQLDPLGELRLWSTDELAAG